MYVYWNGSAWFNSWENEFNYDTIRNIISITRLSAEENTGNLYLQSKEFDYYSSHEVANGLYTPQFGNVRLFPNPARNNIYLDVGSETVSAGILYNSQGEVLRVQQLKKGSLR